MKRWSLGWWAAIIIFGGVIEYFVQCILNEQYQLQEKSPIFNELVLIGVAIVFAVIVMLVYTCVYRKKVKRVRALLDEGKLEEYVSVLEKGLREKERSALENMWKINLFVGYYKLEQYDKALSILEGVTFKKLNAENKAIYTLDLFCVYYKLDQKEKAMEVYNANEKYLARVRKDTKYSGNIAIIDMYAAIEKGRYEGLEEKLRKTRDTWHNPAFQEDYEKIEELLLRQHA